MTQTKKQFCDQLAGRKDMLGEAYKDSEDFVKQAVYYYGTRGRGIYDTIEQWDRETPKKFSVEVPHFPWLVLIVAFIALIKYLLTW